MDRFLLILWGGDAAVVALKPDEREAYLRRWVAWMESLAAAGKLEAGEPLGSEGRMVAPGPVVSDGPYPEAKEAVGGYLIVSAADLDEATELAKSCPHFEVGGSIEVRPIRPISRML